MSDAKSRFSNRVADYVKYRPTYPAELVESLAGLGAWHAGAVVADVGSGTGLLTELFLRVNSPVFGIEPNMEMRAAGEAQLVGYRNFTSVAATAEQTTLGDASVDLIVAGQAFHWFDRAAAKREFQRIGKKEAWTALIWNERLVDASEFLKAYEQVLKRYATDYSKVDHRQMTDEVIGEFFSPRKYVFTTFQSRQEFDLSGLKGRVFSSSYVPAAGQSGHEEMGAALTRLFDEFQVNGRIVFEYETKVYAGQL